MSDSQDVGTQFTRMNAKKRNQKNYLHVLLMFLLCTLQHRFCYYYYYYKHAKYALPFIE